MAKKKKKRVKTTKKNDPSFGPSQVAFASLPWKQFFVVFLKNVAFFEKIDLQKN